MKDWKNKLSLGLLVGSMAAGIVIADHAMKYYLDTYVKEKPKPRIIIKEKIIKKKRLFNEVKIKKLLNNIDIKDKRVDIQNNLAPGYTFHMKPGKQIVTNQKGKAESLVDLIKRSKSDPKASFHVDYLLNKVRNFYIQNPNIKADDLAMKSIQVAWKDNVNDLDHSTDYELKRKGVKGSASDSYSTWGECNSRRDKLNKKLCDCEDSTLEMITEYELMREKAEAGRKKDPFLAKLFEGFLRTQLVGMGYYGNSMYNEKSGHEMMILLKYSDDFKKMDASLFEPQVPNYLGNPKNHSLAFADDLFILWDSRKDDFVKFRKIVYIYTGKGVFVPNK